MLFENSIVKVLLAAVTFVAACGLPRLTLNASYDAYFDADDPRRIEHRQIQDNFEQHDSAVIILTFAEQDALSKDALALTEAIVEDVSRLNHVTRVGSILDVINRAEAGDDLDALLHEALGASSTQSVTQIASHSQVDVDPRVEGLLLSHDQRSSLIEVAYQFPEDTNAKRILDSMTTLRSTVSSKIKAAKVQVVVRYSGAMVLNEAYIRVVRHDLRLFIPVLFILMFTILIYFLRDVRAVVVLLLGALCVVCSAFGVAGWAGLELAAMTTFAPVMIMSLVVSGGVHIYMDFARSSRILSGGCDRLKFAVSANLLPLSITNGTTALGFLALLVSPSPAIRTLGIIVALGIVLGWIYTLVLLPACLGALARARQFPEPREVRLGRVVRFAVGRRSIVIGSFLSICVLALALLPGNEINDNVFEYFPERSQFQQDTAFVRNHFVGVNKLIYVLDVAQPEEAFDLAILRTLRALSDWASQQPEVRRVVCLLDIPQVNRRIGDLTDRSVIDRYKNLASGHTTAGLNVTQFVAPAFSALALHVYLKELDAAALVEFDARVRRWFSANHVAANFYGGGVPIIFAHLGLRNAYSMLYSLLGAIVIISILCAIVLRSWRVGVIGLICNISPLLIAYAGWALIDGRISIGAAIVMGMIIGIIVDDTVYLLTKYRRLSQIDSTSAIQTAVQEVGPALIVTSLSLIAGLAVGVLSDFAPIRAMSELSVAVVALALIIDLLVLVALVETMDRRKATPRRAEAMAE